MVRTRSSREWLEDLARADIPASQLYTVDGLIEDEHLAATGFIRRLEHPSEGPIRTTAPLGTYAGTPTSLSRPAPRLGEHSREVLAQAGYDAERINAMVARGITQDGND
ncbi:Formyl-CoA:oxalate CoA-transferase [compost metagenome]